MALKEFWAQTGRWMRAHNPLVPVAHRPEIGDDGLISRSEGFAEPTADGSPPSEAPGNEIAVRAVPQREGHESLEKLQQGFDKLVEQLRGINEHLSRQVSQHEDLMGRIEQLPQLLESFPSVVENQKRITEQLLERLQSAAAKNEQFIDAVEKIPTETAKQTDALVNIDHQLAAAADVDVQRTESFNNFNDSLDKLNQSTVNQTEGILQMSKTFAASDRYLKYIISKQNKRVMWIFIAAISVCLTAILILTGIIVYLRY
jgi:ABC-type transporter Mla subunit MlaD